jgi:ParB family chromosome partitioning protein
VDPVKLAHHVVARGLNVRQTEKLAQTGREAKAPATPLAEKDADTIALERELASILGLKVTITYRSGGGDVKIHYSTLEQLDDVVQRLSHSPHGDRS